MQENTNNALITISGIHNDGIEASDLEFKTDGIYKRRGGGYQIEYDESEMTGMQGTRTVIEASRDSVMMKRNGSVESCMSFVRGKKQMSYYNTDVGAFVIGINPYDLNVELGASGGHIHIGYTIEVDHSYSGTNVIDIGIRLRDKRSSDLYSNLTALGAQVSGGASESRLIETEFNGLLKGN